MEQRIGYPSNSYKVAYTGSTPVCSTFQPFLEYIMLNSEEEIIAKKLYKNFFNQYPNLKNPSDINCEEKYYFALGIGWQNLQLMQKARKNNIKKYDYPYPWTKN